MKISEINKMIKKHIEQKLIGYFVHRDLIYKPVNDFFIKGYYFESRGNEDLDLAVWYFIQPLFVKKDSIILTLGGRLSYSRKLSLLNKKDFDWWDARKDYWDKSFESILETISTKGEKKLGDVVNAESFFKKFYGVRKDNIRIYEAVAYSTVLFGNEDFQNITIKGLIDFCTSQIDSDDDIVEILIKEDATILLNGNTTEKRLEILKCWTNETIGHLKLPHINPFEG